MKQSSWIVENPWEGINPPLIGSEIASRLIPNVSPSSEVTVCWVVTVNDHRALLITLPDQYPDAPMPKLKVIDVFTSHHAGEKNILIELKVHELSQQFKQLCFDVLAVVSASLPKQLCNNVKLCLEKWQYLLRPESRMSSEAQKGLLAELLFLDRVPLRCFDSETAVKTWTGPLRSPRDFSFGTTYVEVKSNRGSKNPIIKVSSVEQLSGSNAESIYLYVVGLDDAPNAGMTLDDVVVALRDKVAENNTALGELNLRLAAAGYHDDEDYSDRCWKESTAVFYSVEGGFPRIRANSLPFGVDKVSYDIDLRYCTEYITDIEVVSEAITS